MNIKEFAEKSLETMIYPTYKEKITCLTLGLIEEWEELFTEINNPYPDRFSIIGELGDFCFYLYGLGYYFNHLPVGNTGDRIEFDKDIPLLCKIIKKSIRDTNWEISTPVRFDHFVYLIDTFHSEILNICDEFNFNLSDVLSYNVEKLQSRKDRGTIMGDGSR